MLRRLLPLALVTALSGNTAQASNAVDIPHQSFKLDNGLTVIVHEDRKAPIVAVNVWYHVGGKDEPSNRQEFAHLFEHLMFNGSENYNNEWFKPFERVGATDQNGTTSSDRTNYFQNVPTTALDMALWLESDRMGHLLGAVDQKKLDEQRGVVQNEKRQRENQPYGLMFDRLLTGLMPVGHPYHDEMLPPEQLLKDAKLEEVKEWFKQYYGAANATLVLAGDIDLATAKEKAQKFFGHIPSGPPLAHLGANVPTRSASTRDRMQDRVAQARLLKAWITPEYHHPDNELLQLASGILGGSAASRLDARLAHKDQSVDSISAFAFTQEITGAFILMANVKNGVAVENVETAINEELRRLMKDGPTEAELARAKTTVRAGFIRGIERIGGFGGKADVLAECAVFARDSGCFRAQLTRIERASVADVKAAMNRWLNQGDHTLVVEPFAKHTNSDKSAVDRSLGIPTVEQFPDLKFPTIQRAKLANGIEVVLAERHEVPTVTVQAIFDAGYAADPKDKLGLAGFATGLMNEGTTKLDALSFKAKAESLGATMWAGAGVDYCDAGVSALSENLDASLALFADMLIAPRLDANDIERIRKVRLAGIAQEKTQPNAIANRVLPPLLYGEGHAYSMPFTGTGTEASIASISRADMENFLAQWIRPDNATLLVVGDTTMAEIKQLLDKHLKTWATPKIAKPTKNISDVTAPVKPRVFLIDRPGAIQSQIMAGLLAPPPSVPNKLDIDTMNNVLGGAFSARLNMNLREDKHWSYGAYSWFGGAKGQRPYLFNAPVQSDKTAESMAEILRELKDFTSTRPATMEEITDNKNNDIRGLPGQFETANAVLGALRGNLLYNRADDYITNLRGMIAGQTEAAIHAAAKQVIQPEQLTWVVVGDLSKIEASVRALNLGEVKVVDVDGKAVR